jgi:mRNA interferase MazF
VIYEGEKDIVVAFISSKIPSELSDVDVLITKNHAGFRKTGLKVDSVIKLDKIATVLKDLVAGELGELDEELRQEVNRGLKKIMDIEKEYEDGEWTEFKATIGLRLIKEEERKGKASAINLGKKHAR